MKKRNKSAKEDNFLYFKEKMELKDYLICTAFVQ
jgi:hypothetical protein